MANSYDEILDQLMGKGVYAAAIIDREGNIVGSDFPGDMYGETFAVMCATIIGASNSANSEIGRSKVRKIILDSKEGTTILSSVNKDLLLAVIVESGHNVGTLFDKIQQANQAIRKQT